MPFQLRHLVIGAASVLSLAMNAASAAEPSESTAPNENWYWSDDFKNFSSEGALIAAINAFHADRFANCPKPGPPNAWTCSQLVVQGTRPNPTFPKKINGDYLKFSVNAYWYYQHQNRLGTSLRRQSTTAIITVFKDSFIAQQVLATTQPLQAPMKPH